MQTQIHSSVASIIRPHRPASPLKRKHFQHFTRVKRQHRVLSRKVAPVFALWCWRLISNRPSNVRPFAAQRNQLSARPL